MGFLWASIVAANRRVQKKPRQSSGAISTIVVPSSALSGGKTFAAPRIDWNPLDDDAAYHARDLPRCNYRAAFKPNAADHDRKWQETQ
jgi:hypothetical protein